MPPDSTASCTDILRIHGFAALEPGPRLIVLGGVHGDETCGTRGHRARAGRTRRRRAAAAARPAHAGAGRQPARAPAAAARGRAQPQPPVPPDAEASAGRLRGPHHRPAVPAARPARRAARPAFLPERGRGLRDDRPARQHRHARALCARRTRKASSRCTSARRAWSKAGSTSTRPAWRSARRGAPVDEAALAFGWGTNEYMRSRGGYGVTLECGQHEDPAAPEVALPRHPRGAAPAGHGARRRRAPARRRRRSCCAW